MWWEFEGSSMIEIAYYLSCAIAGCQLGHDFTERIKQDLKDKDSNEANLGVLIAYILLGAFPIVNTFIALLALEKVPLVWKGGR